MPVMLCFACSESEPEPAPGQLPEAEPIPLRSAFTAKVQQDNTFTFDLLRHTVEGDQGEKANTFVSPLSVNMALGMALNGAEGETSSEMFEAMRIQGYNLDEVNEYYKFMREELLKVDASTKLKIANSVWYRTGFTVEQSYLAAIRDVFTKDIREADFTPKTLADINHWVSDATEEMIPEALDQISDDAMMYLINAVYFKGIWRNKFKEEATKKEAFTTESGKQNQVDMMNINEAFDYASDENGHYLNLPYGNNAFSMVVVLPQEGKQLSDVLSGLTSNSWNNLSFNQRNVNLKLPRFKADFNYGLEKKILPAMGMKKAFTGLADFSGITKATSICISRVIHKTALEVNEEGTEAAAVTIIETGVTSVGPGADNRLDFFVNEPFLLFIKENSTGVILFAGKMGEVGN